MTDGISSKQVGGTHYQSPYIHWDWVLAIGMGYLAGNATKYLARFPKKGNPRLDLEKALSYVAKIRENARHCRSLDRMTRPGQDVVVMETTRFLRENGITGAAATAISRLATWTTDYDLEFTASVIRGVLLTDYPLPVPLEDSNKHATQPQEDK